MEDLVICPHCGLELDEKIPLALIGSIQLKCPYCGRFYLFERQDDSATLEEVESYLSVGPFRRKIAFSGTEEPRPADPLAKNLSCLVLCLIGPMIIFGIYWLISYLIWYIGQL
ncbi:MAG: hypothetical protein ACFFEV_06080 [Candidatus Thorarchaeota archaeon]